MHKQQIKASVNVSLAKENQKSKWIMNQRNAIDHEPKEEDMASKRQTNSQIRAMRQSR